MRLEELCQHLNNLLEVTRWHDYCPNGLQVEGRIEVQRILCGVTASQALVDAAAAGGYDALLVHHGYFWRGEDGRITGIRRRRLGVLLGHDISLLAYHLPLDGHPVLGNNAQLARHMAWESEGRFGDQDIGWIGMPQETGLKARDIAANLAARLGRVPLLAGDGERVVSRVAWCSGGAQGLFEQAIAAGADLYISGEISEQTTHLAQESGVPYLCAGHHATERYGVQALAHHLNDKPGLTADFLDLPNPV
ncbi:MAG: Nif3-like dinuclear metal center hexameric protein [Azoarcus sp.]|jgi:dinuclear metal center YbgI/SA1388 family protein|nr:Nif3-like dinuclear metal center hexameric protein [Azoarcus sp.]